MKELFASADAELVSVLLESMLYGFSLLMFIGTIWALFAQRSTHQLNRKMLAVAIALLALSTAHLVIHIIRVVQGLIVYRNRSQGTIGYFSNVSQWTFVYKNHLYTAQSLVGDGVILYRCYIVWQSKVVIVIPALLWCATGMTGIASSYTASQVARNQLDAHKLTIWLKAFTGTALITNLVTTVLLAWRIWYVDQKAKRLRVYQNSQLKPILHVIVDAGMIYSIALVAALVCSALRSDFQNVALDLVTPIISITFYMVIMRVGLANRANAIQATTPLGFGSQDNTFGIDRRRRVQVHVMTSTECKVETEPPLSIHLSNTLSNEDRSEIKLEARETV